MTRYADILLPLPFDTFTYQIDESAEFDSLCEGEAVAVEMGHSATNFYTGIVWRIHTQKPNYKTIRKISKRLYDTTLVAAEQRQFWEWLADYYLAPLGDVMRCALPQLIKPKGRDEAAFELQEYTPASEHYIGIINNDNIATIAAKLKGKQAAAYQAILATDKSLFTKHHEIPRRIIKCEMAQLHKLVAKALITLTKRESNISSVGNLVFELPQLTPPQEVAKEAIKEGYKERLCALLHGVTGSGKTEIYIHLIAEQLSNGRDVLMLLPEIALTTQLIERLRVIFGSRVTPYHSKISNKQRTETFLQLAQNFEGGNFIVGARSSIFLPLNKLGLIIVDEEHDTSYKQIDPSPRYNARDCAHILAARFGAKVLLGSATPSLESWVNAATGKFALATLDVRYGEATLPNIIISDSRRAAKRHERSGHFNMDLMEHLKERMERDEQTILFQNRRGFAPYVECSDCGWVARCPNCNVSLTMHKHNSTLRCHYCEFVMPHPTTCPNCGGKEVRPMGFGTEKIEEQLNELIPEARTLRMDRDTATSPTALERIVGSFARHESDIMVGTQMVAKGFDFSNVTLVGILNADNMLLNPDFRAEERAFALMTQVAGRAGRRAGVSSDVVIQTSQPTHRVMQFVLQNDYNTMAKTLLAEREAFSYPPYSRITSITLRHSDMSRLYRGANALSTLLRERFGGRVRGPVPPPVDRVFGEWLVSFIIKIESGASSKRAREVIREVMAQWLAEREFKSITVIYNVDPQ